jgi:hypothetical protein
MGEPLTASTFRHQFSTRLDRAADQAGRGLPLFLGVAAVCAVVMVVLLHLLQAWTLGTAGDILSTLVAGVGVVLAAACLTVLLWVLWKIRRDPGRVGLYALAVVLSVVTIGVCIEVFAGLVALLWQDGMLQAATDDPPSLWRTESYYLWHLLSAVPLLSTPDTVGWHEPKLFTDHLAGGLLLTFKLVVIAPLVRLGLSGYQLVERRRLEQRGQDEQRELRHMQARRGEGQPKLTLSWYRRAITPTPTADAWLPRARAPAPTAVEAWKFLGLLLIWTVVALVALRYVFDPAWSANRWLSGHLQPGVHIHGFHLPLAWLGTAPQWLALTVLLLWSAAAAVYLLEAPPEDLRSLHGAVAAALAALVTLVLLTATVAAVALALLHVGLAATQPELPKSGHPEAALNAVAWAIADALPGPDVPTTLNWTLDTRFVDHWSGALLLLYKLVFISVLVFPLARLVRTHLRSLGAPTAAAETPLLSAAKEFTDRLTAIHAAMNEIERSLVARGRDVPFALSDSSPDIRQAISSCRQAVDELEPALQRVRSLFGDGDVADAADTAETAAADRLGAIQDSTLFTGELAHLDRERVILDRRIADFTRKARAALRVAARS